MNSTQLINLPAPQAAPLLLGWNITYQGLKARVVETEAYTQNDQASHTYRGLTKRNEAMFMNPGTWYLYLSYGVHLCLNLVTNQHQQGEAVLIRALEPLSGLNTMRQNRNQDTLTNLTSGPGKLTQALGLPRSINKTNISGPLKLTKPDKIINPTKIVTTTRIGISQAKEQPWRFYLKNNPHVSRR